MKKSNALPLFLVTSAFLISSVVLAFDPYGGTGSEDPDSRAEMTCVRADSLKCKGACDGTVPSWIPTTIGSYKLVKDKSTKNIACEPTLLIQSAGGGSELSLGGKLIKLQKVNQPSVLRYNDAGKLIQAEVAYANEKKLVSKAGCDSRLLSSASSSSSEKGLYAISMSFGMGRTEEYVELSAEKNNLIRYKWGINDVGMSSRYAWHYDCLYEKVSP